MKHITTALLGTFAIATTHISPLIYITQIINKSDKAAIFHHTSATRSEDREHIIAAGATLAKRLECQPHSLPGDIGYVYLGADVQYPCDIELFRSNQKPYELQCKIIGGQNPHILDRSHEAITITIEEDGTIHPLFSYPQLDEILRTKRSSRGYTFHVPGEIVIPASWDEN